MERKIKILLIIICITFVSNINCSPYRIFPAQITLSGSFIDTLTCSGKKIWLINFDSIYQNKVNNSYGVVRFYKNMTYRKLIFSTGLEKFNLGTSSNYFKGLYEFDFIAGGEADPKINLPQLSESLQICLPKDSVNKTVFAGLLFNKIILLK